MPSLDGIINLNKPLGVSSAKAVYRIRAITGLRKSGHAGTLDPGASGVLVICLGRATKLVEQIMDQPKGYRATARLDVTSRSFDADSPLEPVPVARVPPTEEILQVAARFEGEIEQVPPAISAVKVGGRPAYKRALRNEVVRLAPRRVRVYWIHLHRYEWPEVEFSMACGRGTYVRALIRDWGAALGAGGCLTSLVRTGVGPFSLEEATTVDTLQGAEDPRSCVIPLDRAVDLLSPERIAVPPRPRTETRFAD